LKLEFKKVIDLNWVKVEGFNDFLIGDLWIFLKFINEMIISSNENGMT
jgi:hypothetical protein